MGSDGTPNLEIPPKSLFANYASIPVADVLATFKFFSLRGDDYHVQNNAWTNIKISNSLNDALKELLLDKLGSIVDTSTLGGPTSFKLVMDLIVTTSQQTLRSIITKFAELKLQEFDGKDVVLASGWIRGVVAVLKNGNMLPLDYMIIVFNILKTASDVPFVNQGTSLEFLVTNKVLVANFHDVLTKAESFYQVRKTPGDWNGSKHNVKGSIFAVAQEPVICYGCGKVGHYKKACPDGDNATSTDGNVLGQTLTSPGAPVVEKAKSASSRAPRFSDVVVAISGLTTLSRLHQNSQDEPSASRRRSRSRS